MNEHIDVEEQLIKAGGERFPWCPRCASVSGYLTTWHQGSILDLFMRVLGVVDCTRRGGHFDLWCRKCYFVVGTRAPVRS